MALPCLLKTSAFFSALLSIAVLGLSLVVLISSITLGGESGKTSNAKSQSDESAKKNFTVNFGLLRQQTNTTNITDDDARTATEGSHIPLLQDPATFPSNITASSISNGTEERIEKSTAMSSPSTTMPPSTTIIPTATVHDDDANNTNTSTESTSSTTASPPLEHWNAFLGRQNDFWKSKSDTYIILIQASSGTGIFVALLQLGFSWLLICGSGKGLKERKNLWNLSNFIVLILLIVIILVPLSYNSTNNTFKGASVFFREVFRKFKSVEFSTNTLETIASSVPNFLARDLTLYYYVLGVDSVILLGFLVPPLVCCLVYPCKRCCCKGKREKSESDLMLFSSGGGSFSLGDRDRY